MRAITLILGLLLSLGSVYGQTSTNAGVRELSLQDAIALALKSNLQLSLARYTPVLDRYDLLTAYGYYDPVLNSRIEYQSVVSDASQNFAQGTISASGERTAHTWSSGLTGVLPWGMRYDLGKDLEYLTQENLAHETNSSLPEVFDNYQTDVGLVLQQPLLRGFWIDEGRAAIKVAKSTLKISEFDYLHRLKEIIRDVQLNYYELIFARDDVRVKQKAVELAERLAAENKKRVEVGTLAPLDEKQAESAAATARADLIRSQNQLRVQENLLKNLITDNVESWGTTRIVPTENLIAVPQSYNLPASWVNALTHRSDFNSRKEFMEQQGILVDLRRNQVLPQVDLVGSYGRRGVERQGSFSRTLQDIRDDRLPRYSVGAIFSIPLENRSARGRLKLAKATREVAQLQVKELQQNILIEVEDAVNTAQAEYQRVIATREASQTAEAALDAEQKKLENGKSTSFQVLEFQKALSDARSAEIRALADYNRALTQIDFSEGTILEKRRISVEIK